MKVKKFKFEPKPFVFEEDFSRIYIPNRLVSISKKKGDRSWFCVYSCPVFASYPTLKATGIKIIPVNARCFLGGKCKGNHRVINNVITHRTCVVGSIKTR